MKYAENWLHKSMMIWKEYEVTTSRTSRNIGKPDTAAAWPGRSKEKILGCMRKVFLGEGFKNMYSRFVYKRELNDELLLTLEEINQGEYS
ncbi:hypothetical protein YC2023_071021 [Brassica napus]